jgi:hypothetical protein
MIKRVILILIIIVVLAGIAGGLFWYLQKHKETGISNWKTYRNEEFLYEIKYPPNLKVEEQLRESEEEGERFLEVCINPEGACLSNEKGVSPSEKYNPLSFRVGIFSAKYSGEDEKDFSKELLKRICDGDVKKININGLEGFEANDCERFSYQISPQAATEISLFDETNLFEHRISFDASGDESRSAQEQREIEKKERSIFDQMLATFRVIEKDREKEYQRPTKKLPISAEAEVTRGPGCPGAECPTIENEFVDTSEWGINDRDSQRISDILQLNLALNMYYDDMGTYPVSEKLDKVTGPSSILVKALSPDYLKYDEKGDSALLDPLFPARWYGYVSNGQSYKLTIYPESQDPEVLKAVAEEYGMKIEFSEDKYLIINEVIAEEEGF